MRERFAKGFNLYKVFWIFMVGGVLGCIVETIWCYFAFGELSSRTSNVLHKGISAGRGIRVSLRVGVPDRTGCNFLGLYWPSA